MTRPRSVPEPAPAIVDERVAAWHLRSLTIWLELSRPGFMDTFTDDPNVSVTVRLARLEARIDERGLRSAADRHIQHLADARARWPGGDPLSAA
jgi:hypothetical protein